jgi:hypothetical protein
MRKTKLTTLQNRIMWILEEAGDETLDTIRATLRLQGENLNQSLSAALEGLQRLGFITRSSSAIVLTESGYAALTR